MTTVERISFDPHPADPKQQRVWFLGYHVAYCGAGPGGGLHWLNDFAGTVQERLEIAEYINEHVGELANARVLDDLRARNAAGEIRWQTLADKVAEVEARTESRKRSHSQTSSRTKTPKSALWLPSAD